VRVRESASEEVEVFASHHRLDAAAQSLYFRDSPRSRFERPGIDQPHASPAVIENKRITTAKGCSTAASSSCLPARQCREFPLKILERFKTFRRTHRQNTRDRRRDFDSLRTTSTKTPRVVCRRFRMPTRVASIAIGLFAGSAERSSDGQAAIHRSCGSKSENTAATHRFRFR
jgi:hypothetical protein